MAINNTGEVFIITHAPFEVKKLYSSIRASLHQNAITFYFMQKISYHFLSILKK